MGIRARLSASVVLTCAFALLSAAPADSATTRTRTIHASHQGWGVATFKLRHVRPPTVQSASLKVGRHRQRVRVARVRRAAAKGVLRLRSKLLRHGRRRRAVLVLTVLVAGGLILPGDQPSAPPAPGDSTPRSMSTCPSFGSFRAGNWPGGCWRPYSDASPFNQPIPDNPQLLPGSAAIVKRFRGWNQLSAAWVGTAGTSDDYWHPTYYAQESDPHYTIHCTVYACRDIEGMQIRIPRAARAAGGSDAHMTVVDQRSDWEYDFWEVRTNPLPSSGGTIAVGGGGRTRIGSADANGLGSNANAAQWGLLAGIIRAQELESGQINHALTFVTRCDNNTHVYPARGLGRPCSAVGESNATAPPMGARFQLAMSATAIDALEVPRWKKTILHAMARYGMYLGDTGGGFLSFESGSTYTSFGYRDAMETFAQQHLGEGGISTSVGDDGKRDYVFDLASGVPWVRLRVIAPCVTHRIC
jgi:hypothetical protein